MFTFLIAILHRDLKMVFFSSPIIFFSYWIWTFVSLLYWDFYFSLRLLLLFWTFISLFAQIGNRSWIASKFFVLNWLYLSVDWWPFLINLNPEKWFEGYPVKSTIFFQGGKSTWYFWSMEPFFSDLPDKTEHFLRLAP